ncbi:discoidin domain-containing protein [Nocardioides sp. W7]|uniref:discoidin domain-containing protein n=1 Tax=Nocardioides sp. W7 TaxID=2931390 RepID=UPI001FD577DF|nr:discoidin domain-containing protein [Nocardioides sp. W7]
MTTCTRCGHQFEVGRFCTNCGAAVDPDVLRVPGPGPTDTAERPAVPPVEPPPPPPPLPPAPTSARFPLFADEVGERTDAARTPPPPPLSSGHRAEGRRSGWLVGVAVAAVLVVVALVGVSLLLAGNGDDEPDRADDQAGAASSPPPSEPAGESTGPTGATEPTAATGEPADVAGAASAEVPATSPPGTDVDGARIRYDAAKMLDGDPGTCWRMTGDGTGEEIVLTLAEPTTVTELGLVNGYAKTARDGRNRPLDWYAGNRRVLKAEWVLDDGTTVPQDLRETRDLQTVPIDPVETTTVVLRLVEVSEPGRGRAERDNTAVSEVTVVGTPGG